MEVHSIFTFPRMENFIFHAVESVFRLLKSARS